MSGGDADKKELRKELERELRVDLHDILLVWSSTVLGVFMNYSFENTAAQNPALIAMLFFSIAFVFGGFILTAIAVGSLQYVIVRFLALVGVDRF